MGKRTVSPARYPIWREVLMLYNAQDEQTEPMSITTNIIQKPLPREMQQHTYAILRRVEETHWWFAGRRRIIRSFLERLCRNLSVESSEDPGRQTRLNIVDVGCGTGANLEMLSEFGKA